MHKICVTYPVRYWRPPHSPLILSAMQKISPPCKKSLHHAKNHVASLDRRQRRSGHEPVHIFFTDAKIGHVSRYGAGGPGPAGAVPTASFSLLGQEFIALNGRPSTSSLPPFHSWSAAKRRPRSITIGTRYRRGVLNSDAVGSRINWCVLANYPDGVIAIEVECGAGTSGARHGSDAQNQEARHAGI